jgi:hypothetical protein
MVAQYNISGGCDQFAANIIDIPEGKVNYEVPSFLYYRVTITKNLYVHPAPEQ